MGEISFNIGENTGLERAAIFLERRADEIEAAGKPDDGGACTRSCIAKIFREEAKSIRKLKGAK